MKATNKHEFFELLETELNRIGIEDTADIFADFEEHFSDSAMQGIPEDITAERLGDIKEIARSYLNLESSRINSIMARDVEHRKVSLTKPGRGVPADLSLLDNSVRDAINSDNIREYTPQHFSGEIYPDNSNRVNNNGSGFSSGVTGSSAGSSGNASSGAGSAAAGAANPNKSVADAFSEAGRAAVDAAKITGHAVADAFKQGAVKDAVVGAGKQAADAVKAATHSAAEAINKATAKHEAKKHGYNGVPHPTDSYRQNMNTAGAQHTDSFRDNDTSASHQGTIPPQSKKAKTDHGFKFISTKDLKMNVNSTKLVTAILLDIFLWSWLVPAIFSFIIGLGLAGIATLINETFDSFNNYGYNIISRFFRAGMFGSAAVMAVCVGWWVLKLPIKLVVYIINMHIKAAYDL